MQRCTPHCTCLSRGPLWVGAMCLHPGPSLAISSPQCTLIQLLSSSEEASHILPCYKYVQIPGQLRAPGPRQSWGYLSPNLQDIHFQDRCLESSDHGCPLPSPHTLVLGSQAAASWPRTRRNCCVLWPSSLTLSTMSWAAEGDGYCKAAALVVATMPRRRSHSRLL